MGTTFEDLRMLQDAEKVADSIWGQVTQWESFAKDVVGGQLARTADSIGANIAESFGRYHYGEKLQFMYYARGSLFKTKYWLNRTLTRNLMPSEQAEQHISQLTGLARQINAFANSLKRQRQDKPEKSNTIREAGATYTITEFDDISLPLFDDDDFEWLQTVPNNL